MARINLSGGRWFDDSKATKYEEDTWWNGNNHISKATGCQWDHEVLYKTANGSWVLHWWSQWQGSVGTYEIISEDAAHQWLIQNEHYDAVPDDVLDANEA